MEHYTFSCTVRKMAKVTEPEWITYSSLKYLFSIRKSYFIFMKKISFRTPLYIKYFTHMFFKLLQSSTHINFQNITCCYYRFSFWWLCMVYRVAGSRPQMNSYQIILIEFYLFNVNDVFCTCTEWQVQRSFISFWIYDIEIYIIIISKFVLTLFVLTLFVCYMFHKSKKKWLTYTHNKWNVFIDILNILLYLYEFYLLISGLKICQVKIIHSRFFALKVSRLQKMFHWYFSVDFAFRYFKNDGKISLKHTKYTFW